MAVMCAWVMAENVAAVAWELQITNEMVFPREAANEATLNALTTLVAVIAVLVKFANLIATVTLVALAALIVAAQGGASRPVLPSLPWVREVVVLLETVAEAHSGAMTAPASGQHQLQRVSFMQAGSRLRGKVTSCCQLGARSGMLTRSDLV